MEPWQKKLLIFGGVFVIIIVLLAYNKISREREYAQLGGKITLDPETAAFHEKVKAQLAEQQRKRDSTKRADDSLSFIEFKKNKKAFAIFNKHPEFGTDACVRLAKRQIWIGMTLDMLKYQRGLPNHVHTSDYGDGVQYQWCWDDYEPSCFYGGSDCIVTSYN
jgi:hypothetical protein